MQDMTQQGNGRRAPWAAAGVLALALAVNLAAGVATGLRRPMQSDGFYYLRIAASLADGRGYVLREGFWPDTPTMSRSPAWPFAVSLALRVFRGMSPDLVMRVLDLALNAMVAALVALLACRLTRRTWAGVLAGLGYAVHPTALHLALNGGSEIPFAVLALAGVLLILRGGRIAEFGGYLALGLACLTRANFVLWIACAGAMAAWRLLRERRFPSREHPAKRSRSVPAVSPAGFGSEAAPPRASLGRAALAAALFLLPSLLWAGRNARVCGHFPVLSTLRGQTFYGGNNSVVADTLEYWGYWVFPNSIPGEPPMVELAQTMSEYEVDAYYYNRGLGYLRAHLFQAPRLLLGKLIRAYVPMPWKASWGAYAVGVYRVVLYLAAVFGFAWLWRGLDRRYGLVLGAMLWTNALTVLLFWGCARFAFPLDPFLLPAAGFAAERLARVRVAVGAGKEMLDAR
jgi:hypothetical protein